jgi:hypothetical protein
MNTETKDSYDVLASAPLEPEKRGGLAEFPRDLCESMSFARRVIEEIDNHESAIAQVAGQLREAEREMEAAQASVGERAAALALSGGSMESVSGELRAAQDRAETLRTALAALRKTLPPIRDGAIAAAYQLRVAFSAFGSKAIDDFVKGHAVIAQQYADSVERGSGLALSLRRSASGFDHLTIPDPRVMGKELVPRRVLNSPGVWAPRWTTMPDLAEELAPIAPLMRLMDDIARVADKAEREKQRVVSEPSVSYLE